MTGCGKKASVEEVEARMNVLTEKGIPDSVLANLKVYIYNIRSGQKVNNFTIVKKYSDSMRVAIVKAEEWYANALETTKPYLESLRKSIVERKSNLTGLHLLTADSILNIADSLEKINFLVFARTKMDKLDSLMPVLLENEKKAQEISKKIIGKWGDAHWEKAEDANYKALSRRFFTFKKDGTFESSEEMVGQTTPYMKEDWLFLSWGKYAFKGDTIHLNVTREKCPKQVFTHLNVRTNKWEKKVSPTYDSLITNGSKDKFLIFSDFKSNFKKI